MNELDCRRMLTIAKEIRNVATNEKWAEDDQMRILAQLAVAAYEEISRLKMDRIALRTACQEAGVALSDALARTAPAEH